MSNKFHNKGQEDAANGVYDPPHSISEELFSAWTHEDWEEIREDRAQYQEGREHHLEQSK